MQTNFKLPAETAAAFHFGGRFMQEVRTSEAMVCLAFP